MDAMAAAERATTFVKGQSDSQLKGDGVESEEQNAKEKVAILEN